MGDVLVLGDASGRKLMLSLGSVTRSDVLRGIAALEQAASPEAETMRRAVRAQMIAEAQARGAAAAEAWAAVLPKITAAQAKRERRRARNMRNSG